VYLYLVRHGVAVSHGSPGISSDAERGLSNKGIVKVRRNARALACIGVEMDEIWTSPLIRARQTADLLAEGLQITAPVRVVEYLQPEGKFEALTSELEQHLEQAGIALVGHEPYLGELATYLLTGVRSSSFRFKKGGVACIEVYDATPPIHCQLRWLVTPKQMAAIVKK
jgi:phosphohistidine phosphatase